MASCEELQLFHTAEYVEFVGRNAAPDADIQASMASAPPPGAHRHAHLQQSIEDEPQCGAPEDCTQHQRGLQPGARQPAADGQQQRHGTHVAQAGQQHRVAQQEHHQPCGAPVTRNAPIGRAFLHRRGELRASKIMADRARSNPKITFTLDTVVDEIMDPAKNEVMGARLRNVKTGQTTDKAVSAVFVAIGHEPNSRIFKGQLNMDAEGYLKTHEGVKTNVPGVFACGDVQDRVFRQAITASGSGCSAAILAERFLESTDSH